MNRQIARGLILVAALLAAGTRSAAEPERPSVTQLNWLAGCWESMRGDRHMEEQWMWPRGGTMLGMNRTVSGGRMSAFETLRIEERDGKLVFTSLPSGQKQASFESVEVGEARIVFENPAHDFPQRIIYELAEDGSLLARIEGERDGELRGVDFPLGRAECAQGTAR